MECPPTVLCAEHTRQKCHFGKQELLGAGLTGRSSWGLVLQSLLSLPPSCVCLHASYLASKQRTLSTTHPMPRHSLQVCCDQQPWPEPSETASQNKLSAIVSVRHFGHSDLVITNTLVHGPGVMAKWPCKHKELSSNLQHLMKSQW